MEAHEWMVKSTYQTEWISGRGIFLWLAMYMGGLGGGLYLVSLYFNDFGGMLISLLIVAGLKGGFHFAYLGKPWRFWRLFFRPQTSWLARGFIFVVLFTVFAAVQLVLSWRMPGSPWETLFKVSAGLMAFGLMVYTGFVLNSVRAVSFWNSPLLPVLFVMWGFLGGLGGVVLIGLYGGNVDIHAAERGGLWLMTMSIPLLAVYLWTALQRDETGKRSVIEQVRGRVAPVFWIGMIFMGIAVPLAASVFSFSSGEILPGVLIPAVVCELIGGLSTRYCFLKVGAYKPLFPRPRYLKP